jgi:5-methyltetrahydropteroyltriglutamate--homocysteine methyltransferase
LLTIRARAYGFKAADPRQKHEWMVWKDVKLPEGKTPIPGLTSRSTDVVKRPELVKNIAGVVDKENLTYGLEGGFSPYSDRIRVHPTVPWVKLRV